MALPFPDACFDTVVSFQTIKHVTAQKAFFDEVRHVLRPRGLVALSCPNKVEYTGKRGVTNELHVRELNRDEPAALLAPCFPHTAWYGQWSSFYSVVWPEQGEARGEGSGRGCRGGVRTVRGSLQSQNDRLMVGRLRFAIDPHVRQA